MFTRDEKIIIGVMLVILFALLAPVSAKASDAIVFTCCSWHASNHELGPKDTQDQEGNRGIGWEHTLTPNTTFTVGEYSNSFRKHTDYIGLEYQPFHLGNWKFGLFVGDATGYRDTKYGEVVAMPFITYQTTSWGVNLMALTVPPVSAHFEQMARTKSVFALQFKVMIP